MMVRSRVVVAPLLSLALVVGSVSPGLAQPAPPASSAPPAAAPPAPAPTPTPPPSTPPAPPPAGTPAPPPAGTPPPAATAPAGAPPGAMAPPAAPAATPGWPQVTFQPDRSTARLERRDAQGGEGAWVTVCQGPCSQPMDARHGYRIGGDDVVPSPWFKFPRAEEPITLKADTGSQTSRTVGYVLAGVGPVLSVVGLLVMAPGKLDDSDRSAWDGRTIGGGALLVGGMAALFTGLALIGGSSTTTKLERTASGGQGRLRLGLDGVKF